MFKSGDTITPVSLGGSSYRDTKLTIKDNVASIKASPQSYIFETGFQSLIWLAYFFMTSIASSDNSNDATKFITIVSISCFSFSAIIRFIFYKIRKPKYFDKNTGHFYAGRKFDKSKVIALSDITTLYLISKEIYSSGKTYTTHELSLCTNNGRRETIINHSERYIIELETVALAKFLGLNYESLRNGHKYVD